MRSGARTTSDEAALAGLVALAFAAVIMGGLFLGYRDVDVWGAFVVPLLLFGLTAPALLAGERRRGSGMGNLFVLGLALTFVASYVYYLITFHYYPGGDAGGYHDVGSSIAEDFWAGRLGVVDLVPTGRGTEFIEQATGAVEVVVGRSLLAAQMVFAWLKFLGVLLFINAARRGVPGLLDRRYATLMLFMPSVLYWPSALGKDAWMLFMLGLASYGASLVFERRLHGWALAAFGIYGCLLVRPHLALILAGALAVAYVTSTRPGHRSSLGPVARVLGAGVLVVGLSFALSATSDLLPTFSPSDPLGTAGDALDSVQGRTAIGGSEIDFACSLATPMSGASPEMTLRDYGGVVRRRKWIVIVSVLLAVLVAVTLTALQTPIYESSSEVLVQARGQDSLYGNQEEFWDRDRSIQTEIQVIEGEAVQLRVQENLGLDEPPSSASASQVGTNRRDLDFGARRQRRQRSDTGERLRRGVHRDPPRAIGRSVAECGRRGAGRHRRPASRTRGAPRGRSTQAGARERSWPASAPPSISSASMRRCAPVAPPSSRRRSSRSRRWNPHRPVPQRSPRLSAS
jgi:hypothetical protein